MKSQVEYPKALSPPLEKISVINQGIIQHAINSSSLSPRKRIILPLHKSPADSLHRMLNALQPESYVQPHRHLDPPKAESIIVLKGAIAYIQFNDTGKIENIYHLSADSTEIGIDTEPGIYHTFFAKVEETVLFEVKPGPYEKGSDKDFAPWAPAEGTESAIEYMQKLYELTKE